MLKASVTTVLFEPVPMFVIDAENPIPRIANPRQTRTASPGIEIVAAVMIESRALRIVGFSGVKLHPVSYILQCSPIAFCRAMTIDQLIADLP